jgi:hypothetical protein
LRFASEGSHLNQHDIAGATAASLSRFERSRRYERRRETDHDGDSQDHRSREESCSA